MSEDISVLYLVLFIGCAAISFRIMVYIWTIFQRYRSACWITLILTIVLGKSLHIVLPMEATIANQPWLIGGIILVCFPFMSFLAWIFLQEMRLIPSVHDRHPASKDAGNYPAS